MFNFIWKETTFLLYKIKHIGRYKVIFIQIPVRNQTKQELHNFLLLEVNIVVSWYVLVIENCLSVIDQTVLYQTNKSNNYQ